MPLITDILIPNVEPFTIGEWTHPGGDLKYSDYPFSWSYDPPFFAFRPQYLPDGYRLPSNLQTQLPLATPLTWNPVGASISTWSITIKEKLSGYGPDYVAATLIPLDFTCQPYWDSKEELMDMIAHSGGHVLVDPIVPILFKSAYWNEVYHYWIFCPYCNDYIATGSSTHQQNSTHIREDSARYLLSHIETAHPTHLLTEPAWF
jgi:hypothetical protein